jgi:two-component system KDP operon response regulator KdpE
MNTLTVSVLIVEDEKQIRRFVRTSLEAQGHKVFEADSTKQGLIEAGTRKPDLVILDLGLPDLDGVEFIRDLRGWSAMPVIVLSARTNEADKIAALDAGADESRSEWGNCLRAFALPCGASRPDPRAMPWSSSAPYGWTSPTAP